MSSEGSLTSIIYCSEGGWSGEGHIAGVVTDILPLCFVLPHICSAQYIITTLCDEEAYSLFYNISMLDSRKSAYTEIHLK